jgi:outer membrane lipoprotein SlyB
MQQRSGAALNTRVLSLGLILAGLSGCGPSYSPHTYASNAVQQANKVDQGTVIGVREVSVSAAGTTGTVTGAAAGGIAGSQMGTGATSAFASLGGALVGGLAGTAAEHVAADTKAFEYIVRKGNGELVSVTQKDKTPLALGQHVLVIAGNQARIVPDYTVPPEVAQATPEKAAEPAKPADPVKSTDLAQPADAAKTTDPAKPAEAAKPVDLAKPAEAPVSPDPGQASAPAAPAEAAKSADIIKPAEPSKPAEPEAKAANAPPADAKPAEAASAALMPVRLDAKPASPGDVAKPIGATLP